jgi:hypothetical protein
LKLRTLCNNNQYKQFTNMHQWWWFNVFNKLIFERYLKVTWIQTWKVVNKSRLFPTTANCSSFLKVENRKILGTTLDLCVTKLHKDKVLDKMKEFAKKYFPRRKLNQLIRISRFTCNFQLFHLPFVSKFSPSLTVLLLS